MKPDPRTGKSRLQTLKDIQTQTGVVTSELRNLLPLPWETKHLWACYQDLSMARARDMGAPLPLTWEAFDAYFRLRQLKLQKWEIDTIRVLDAEFLASQADDSKGSVSDASALRKTLNEPAANRSRGR